MSVGQQTTEGFRSRVNTKFLLSASAVVLGVLGVVGSFLPDDVVTAAGVAPNRVLTVLVQLLGALMFAFAMANWVARASLFGGIYNRSLAMGNLTHFVMGALALTKVVIAGERHIGVMFLAAVYIAFALAFTATFFRSPALRGSP